MLIQLEKLFEISDRRVRNTTENIKRYLYSKIDWRDRLICIKGARGTGKTTLMLQYLKENFLGSNKAIYISLDNIIFSTISLIDIAEDFVLQGGELLVLDEIHHYKNWQTIIKNLNDDYKDLKIIYSGSSLLKMESAGGDLSRRQMVYNLYGLSFREYLLFEEQLNYDPICIEELVSNHASYAESIISEIKIHPIFSKYLQNGYYPFYKDVFAGYYNRIGEVINQVLESDYPAVEDISTATIIKIKKMLMILAENCPQTPKMSELYRQLETDRNQGLKMLNVLYRTQLLALLSSEKKQLKDMSRPDKIYCDNTNIMHAIVLNTDKGCERETFFLNQMRAAGHEVTYPPQGDFIVNKKYLFEVGGRKKSFNQIADIDNSFLAVDDTEVGRGNRIPLWMFGFMY